MILKDPPTFGFQWHVTDRCLGVCRHCYQSRFDGGAELPLDAVQNIADHIMTFFRDIPVCINLTGGEPLLYDGVFELMARISSYDNLDEFSLITSTHGMGRSVIDSLKAIPKLTSVKVSLESHDPAVNDGIRGAGHFDMTARNIRSLTEAGLPVIVMATLGKHNHLAVEGLCSLSADIGAAGIILERYVPLGRGANLSGNALTRGDWVDVAAAVCRAVDMDRECAGDLLQYRAFRLDFQHGGLSGALCELGRSSMALMPNGTVYPCRRCPVPVGKLPEDGMGHILTALDEYGHLTQRCYAFDF